MSLCSRSSPVSGESFVSRRTRGHLFSLNRQMAWRKVRKSQSSSKQKPKDSRLRSRGNISYVPRGMSLDLRGSGIARKLRSGAPLASSTNIQELLGLDFGWPCQQESPGSSPPKASECSPLFLASSPLFNRRHAPLCRVGHSQSRDPGSAQCRFEFHH